MPLSRMTTRRWMVAVAVAGCALSLGLEMQRRSESYREIASGVEMISSFVEVDLGEAEFNERTDEAEKLRLRLRHYKILAQQYRRAARRPWLPVPTDPPEPK